MKQISIFLSANKILITRRLISVLLFAVVIIAGSASAGVSDEIAMERFEEIIDTRCTICHTRERVDQAIDENRDLQTIQSMMLERGAVITERDKEVLGTFWGDPLKDSRKQVTPVKVNGLLEYRRIIETHCIECHSRERIDGTVRQQLRVETVEEIMLKRGVVLSEREKKVIGTFWGTPLRER